MPNPKNPYQKKLRWSKKWEGVGSQFFTPPLIVVVVVWWNTLDWINALNCSRVSAGHLTYTNIGRATDTSWNLWASNVSQQIPWGKFISAMDIWKNIVIFYNYFDISVFYAADREWQIENEADAHNCKAAMYFGKINGLWLVVLWKTNSHWLWPSECLLSDWRGPVRETLQCASGPKTVTPATVFLFVKNTYLSLNQKKYEQVKPVTKYPIEDWT